MKWSVKHRGSAAQLSRPLIAEDGLAASAETTLDTYPLGQDITLSQTNMSGSRSSPPADGPEAVLIDSGKDKDSGSHGSSAPPTRPQSREKSRSVSPGMNGTGGTHSGGITQRTQIQVSKRTPTVRSGWKLKYQDFIPPKKTENPDETESNFKSLLDRANEWLNKNHEVTVKSLETIAWMDYDPKHLGDSEKTVLCKRVTENAKTYHLRGIRLWLLPQKRHRTQMLAYTDFTPGDNENVPSIVDKINKKIQQKQLTGKILTVETTSVPVINGNIDSDITRWVDDVNVDCPYAFCLRVFYDKHNPGNSATIGLEDFVPKPCPEEIYEGFDRLSDRANTWLKDQSDIVVTNMQSIMVQKNDGPHSETGSACFFSMPGIHNDQPLEFFRILRVGYLRPSEDVVSELPVIYPFTYEMFSPEFVPHRDGRIADRMERFKETAIRINAFLRNSGADVISVETVMTPMQVFPEDDDDAQFVCPDDIQFFYTVRLFLTDQITESDGSLQPSIGVRELSVSRKGKETTPVDHPGPIFLKNVVTRRMKSRWLIFAAAGIISMSIIVVISVIYAN